MREVRTRIPEMPELCKNVYNTVFFYPLKASCGNVEGNIDHFFMISGNFRPEIN